VNLDKREKRTPEQMRKHHKHYIYIHDDVWDALRVHALKKGIAPARLTRDLLTAWVYHFTPWENPGFVEGIVPLHEVELPEEPYDGYFYEMGFGSPDIP